MRLDHLITLVKPFYESTDPAHDWAHVNRVVTVAKFLSEGENVNMNWVLAGAYCHDLVNLPKNHPERKQASTLSAQKARELLKLCDFEEQDISSIQKIIIEHSYSLGETPTLLESAIVQDADRLDALGAIGILRCAGVNAKMGSSFYEPTDPLAEKRPLDDRSFMLDHYFEKLFKLPDLMITKKGKNLAQERVKFMKTFLHELLRDIGYVTCG